MGKDIGENISKNLSIKYSQTLKQSATDAIKTSKKKQFKTRIQLLSEQQALDADPKAIQQIIFTGNLDQAGNNNVFHYWRSKKNVLDFSQATVRVLWMCPTIYFALM